MFSEVFGLKSSFEISFQWSGSWFSLFSRASLCVAFGDVKLGKLQVSPRWEEDLTMQQPCLWVENTILQAFLEDIVILLSHWYIYWTGMYFVSKWRHVAAVMLKCQLFSYHPLHPGVFHAKKDKCLSSVVLMIIGPVWPECEGQVDFPSGSKVPCRFLDQISLSHPKST